MSSAYVLPQVEVFQIFRRLPQNVVKNLNAFVFGPHYQLFRYAVAAEKELTGLKVNGVSGYLKDADTTYSWAGVHKPAGSIVDTDYVKVFADNVWAKYLTIAQDDTYSAQLNDASARNKVHVDHLVLKTGNGVNRSAILKRDVRVGDRVRYTFNDGEGAVFTKTTKVVGFESDFSDAAVAAPANKASNAATQAGDSLGTGSNSVFAYGAGNTNLWATSKVYALAGTQFPGSLAHGVLADTITVTVTAGGVAGAAYATVRYASGIYTRENVLIEDAGDPQIYIGNDMYVEFTSGAAETAFAAGDVFTVEVEAPFTKQTTSLSSAGGLLFAGTRNTSYVVDVVRGGTLARAVTNHLGVVNSQPTAVLAVQPGAAASANWAAWLGGDVDDEYVLRCTSAGSLATAEWSLISARGDDQAHIVFEATGTEVALGSNGLMGKITLASGNFAVGDSWVITVKACRPQVRISDTAGIDDASYVVVTPDVAISLGTLGATITFASATNVNDGLLQGDVYYVAATAGQAAEIRTLVLADQLNANIPLNVNVKLEFFLIQNSVQIPSRRDWSAPDYNWEADSTDGLTIYAGLAVTDASWGADYLPVEFADLYVEYRALRTDYADTIHAMTDINDVVTLLGTIHPDNPLAQGVYNALLNSGNRTVYYMASPVPGTLGWSLILDRATLSEDVYALVPLTRDSEVLEMVEGHITTMSTETEKRWRLGFFAAAMPELDPVYTSAAHPDGENFLATITAEGGENIKLTFVDADGDPTSYTEAMDALRSGDKVRIGYASDPWGTATYDEYEIDTVADNTTVYLKTGPVTTIDMPSKVEVYHPYTLAEKADAYAAVSSGYMNRRIYNVFPSQLSSGGIVQTGEFGAAAVAGLMSSVPPQQPITHIELNGFDDLPLVYQTFNRTQLNKMAEYGTLIIMQDMVGGTVYIRHQVSTKARDGNLNETELSIVKNFDSISYYFAKRFAPYIGKYNVTPGLLNVIELILRDGMNYLGSLTDVGLLGPQILLDETEIVGIQQHPELADHVIATVNVGLPKPFNVLQLRLVV